MDLSLPKSKGSKITKHKLAVFELFEHYKHLDANKIHTLLKNSGNDISIATIYRILATFEANGLITKHNFNEDQSIYELARPNEHHDHLICMKCHTVIEFFDCKIEKIQEKIAKQNNFTIVNHQLNLYGICANCNK